MGYLLSVTVSENQHNVALFGYFSSLAAERIAPSKT